MNTNSGPDLATLRKAVEGNDAALLASFYADDAEIRLVDKNNTPSNPLFIRGKDAIERYYIDVCGRGLTHRVDDEIAAGERIAFTEECGYPDGTRVLCATVMTLDSGKIIRQTGVQAWDE